MKNLLIIFFLFLCYNVVAQQRFPSGTPTQFSTGWFKQGYQQSDSGTIVANRDTTWKAKYSGTIVFRPGDKKFYYFDSTVLAWFPLASSAIDTTSLSNRINLKLNTTDTTNKWWGVGKRWVDTVYRKNDSTIGFTINNGAEQTFQILGRSSSPGSGLTSVGLSMPSAFSVSGSPLTSNGTINVSGAGASTEYIRGNGTLATTDTGMIPNFYLKVRGLITGTSPITFSQTTGAIGINNASASGTKGAASFTGSFSDNGNGLIDLANLVSAGSCTGCNLNIDAKGRITGYTDGAGGATNNVNIGSGFRPVNAITQEMRTYFAGFGTILDTVTNTNGITWSADTTRGTGLPTYYYIDSLPSENISNTSLTANGNYSQNWSNKQWYVDSIAGQFLFRMGGVGATGTRRKEFRINWGGPSFGDNIDGYNMMAVIKKADNSADSLRLGLISSGTGVLSMGAYDVANQNNNTFISYNQPFGLLNIYAKDSIWVKGALPAATADSIVGLVTRGANGVSKMVKIPLSAAGGGGATLNNIAAGYRWAATPNGNIKTFYTDITGSIDSSSNTNGLTYKVDTGYIATQYDLTLIDNGGGLVYNYSALEPTGSDTSKLWVKTPDIAGVYNVYTYVSNLQYKWQRFGWLSIDGVFSNKRPTTIAICGQSNAAGVGSGGDTSWLPGIIAFGQVGGSGTSTDYQTVWRQARINQSPFYSSNNNIAFQVAKRLKRNNDADIVRIITTYEGGTNLSAWINYLSNPTFLLDTFRSRLNRSGIDTIDVFLWHQGESGGITGFTLGGYYVDQKVFYDTLCSPLTTGFFRNYTKYIAGGLGDATDSTAQYNPGSPEGAQRRLNDDGNLNTAWVPSWGLSDIGDDIHFTGTAIDTLGFRYYTELLRLPHAPIVEQPAFMYDTLYDNYKVYENLLTDYNGGSPAFRLLGTGISWKTNAYGRLLTLAPSPGAVNVGESVGFTNSVHKMFTVNGKATISDGSYNAIISGNWNVTGDPAHNVVVANYPLDFNTSSGGDESVLIGFDAGYSTVNMPFNSVVIGSEAGKNTSANFVNYVGRQSGENTTGVFNAFYGPRSGRNSQGSYNTSIGADAGALNSTARVNATAIGYNTKYNEDSVFVAGSGLKKFYMDTLDFVVNVTPTNGQYFAWNNTSKQFELTSAASGITTLNTLTATTQTFATGTSGTDFNISSSSSTHTFNIPSASTVNRGLITTTSQTLGGQKTFNDGIVATSGANSRVTINGNVSVSGGPSTYGDGLAIDFFTHTNTSAAGTVSANQNFNFIASPTLTSSNAISYTGDVATIRFAGAPIASGSTTISHPYNILANDVNFFGGISMLLNEQSGDATIANASGVNVYTGAGGNTWTLPSLATHPGKFIFIKNAGGGNLTVQRAGSDNIYDTSSVTSITIAAGVARVFMAGSSFWYVQ